MSLFKIETNGSGMQHIWFGNVKVRLDGPDGRELLSRLQAIETAAKLLNYDIKQELHLKISFQSNDKLWLDRKSFSLYAARTKTGRLRDITIINEKNERIRGRMSKDISKVFDALDKMIEEM